jgi:CRP-like cAMP-binding protein
MIHTLIYTLKSQQLEEGSMVLKIGDEIDRIIFVERGQIEVYTEFEGNEFVIDRLGPGAVINPGSFWLGDLMTVNMRCGMFTAIYSLSKEDVDLIRLDNPEFNKKL